jgi:hypothetical protein
MKDALKKKKKRGKWHNHGIASPMTPWGADFRSATADINLEL